jgi:hypothetical protein
MAPLTALTSLNLEWEGLSNEGVTEGRMAPLTALDILDLSGCDRVTTEGWSALALQTHCAHQPRLVIQRRNERRGVEGASPAHRAY